jgi:hypothetical protein
VDKPVKRLQRSYSREKKIQVLTFLAHHKVVRARQRQQRRRDGASEADTVLSIDVLLYRDVTLEEAGAFFKIPVSTIHNWWARREAILQNNSREGIPWWPDLEERLYEQFWERRQQRLVTSMGWFRRESRELFTTLYPESSYIFTFSRGWFARFLQRHCITRRRITHQAQKLPEELLDIVSSFLRQVIFFRTYSIELTSRAGLSSEIRSQYRRRRLSLYQAMKIHQPRHLAAFRRAESSILTRSLYLSSSLMAILTILLAQSPLMQKPRAVVGESGKQR